MATRFYPYSRYDFVATEHYLTEQAELGLFPVRLGSTFIHFEEGTPDNMTYRFVPISKEKRDVDVITVAYDGLDAVYLQDVRGDYISFWMQKGNVIVSGYYHYDGAVTMADITENLDLFVEMMA